MKIKNFFKNLITKKKGALNLVHEFNVGSETITQPISEDIDGDKETETIIATTKGEIIVFSDKQKIKWRFKVNEEVSEEESMFLDKETSNSINQQPLITDLFNDEKKQIIFGTEYGSVYCLSHEGKILWKYQADHPVRGGINYFTMKENKKIIIFGSSDKCIYLVSSKGKLLRKIVNDAEIESTPEVIKNNIIFGDNQGKIRSLNFKGKVNWTYKTKDKVIAKPVYTKLYDGTDAILIGGVDNKLYCLSLKGELIWSFETEGAIYTEPAIIDINEDSLKEIVFGSADGKIYVLTLQGNLLWNYETDFWVIGKPITKDLDDDGLIEVVVGSYDNNVYVLSGKGLYIIEYVPGVSGIVAQNGNYSDIPSNAPGEITGEKIWDYGAGGIVVGCSVDDEHIIVQTKEGRIIWLNYKKEEN